jgi:hypothetical protein
MNWKGFERKCSPPKRGHISSGLEKLLTDACLRLFVEPGMQTGAPTTVPILSRCSACDLAYL